MFHGPQRWGPDGFGNPQSLIYNHHEVECLVNFSSSTITRSDHEWEHFYVFWTAQHVPLHIICLLIDISVRIRCRAWASPWLRWTQGSCRLSGGTKRPSPCSCPLLMATLWQGPGSSSPTPAPVTLELSSSTKYTSVLLFWLVSLSLNVAWEAQNRKVKGEESKNFGH